MLQTLYYIPREVGGLPVFGFGLLFFVFLGAAALWMGWLIYQRGFDRETQSYIPLLVIVAAVILFVLPRIVEPDGLPIRGYGVMLLVAIVAAVGLAVWRAKREGIDPDAIINLCFWGVIPGLIGARLFFVVEYWDQFERASRWDTLLGIINYTKGGLVVYGSFIGGLMGVLAYLWYARLPKWQVLDLIAPSVALGSAIGRIGCLLNGCCYGAHCELPWAVTFPATSPAFIEQVERGEVFVHGLKLANRPFAPPVITDVAVGSPAAQAGLRPGRRITAINGFEARTTERAWQLLTQDHKPGSRMAVTLDDGSVFRWMSADGAGHSLPIHPTQVYSTVSDALICLFLLAYAPYRRVHGELSAMLLTLYPITRFLLEAIRVDEPAVFGTGLSISQNISVVVLLVAALLWAYLMAVRARKKDALGAASAA